MRLGLDGAAARARADDVLRLLVEREVVDFLVALEERVEAFARED